MSNTPLISFSDWYDKWQKLADYTGVNLDEKEWNRRTDAIVSLWAEQPQGNWQRSFERGDFNLRNLCTPKIIWSRNSGEISQNRGEYQIEDHIIKNPIPFCLKSGYQFEPIVNAFPCAKVSKGSVEFDLLSILKTPKNAIHPLVCEIKAQYNNPWYAAVENLRQLKLFIGNLENNLNVIRKKRADEILIDFSHPVGIVIAEPDYYGHRGQKNNSVEPTLNMLRRLQVSPQGKDARVILATWDKKTNHIERYGGCELDVAFSP